MSSSRGSFQPRDRSQVSPTAGRFFTVWTTREASDSAKHYISGIAWELMMNEELMTYGIVQSPYLTLPT